MKGQKVRLTSSEFPELEVEGNARDAVNLRKKLNKMMSEKRRKSGSVSGKMSPSTEKKVEARDIEDVPTTKIGAQGAEPTGHSSKTMPSPIKKKKKLTAAQKAKGRKEGDSKTTADSRPPKELSAAARAKRGLGLKKKIPKAKRKGTYGPDSGEQSWTDIIKEGWQELWRDKQPTGEESTGVKDVPVKDRYETPAQALAPDPEQEKLAEEYEQQFLSDEALRDQFDPTRRERPKVIQEHIDDPSKLFGGSYPVWWPEGKEKMGEGGIRRRPGESLEDVDKRVSEASFEDLEGTISDEAMANQLVLDEQRKALENPKAKDLDISSLPEKRQENIQKLFDEKDPEAELIASEYEAQAAIKDAEDRRKLAKEKAKEQRIVGPEPTPESQDVTPFHEYESKYGPGSFKKTEEKIQKIQYIRDHHPDMPKKDRYKNIEKEIDQIPDKETTAEVREADPDWYIDPYTGFAIDLNKLQARQDRKDAMEMASLLPADKRAMFLYQEDLIEKNDLDKLLEPSEKEKLEKELKTMQIAVQASNLLLNNKKLQNYQSPEQKEWHTSYRNAVTNDDYDGIYTFGRKLGLNEAELEKIVEGHKKANVAKATKSDTDLFKKRFNIPYTKVWDARQRVMMESAKVFEEGQADFSGIMGGKYAGRKGLLEDHGLFEHEDIIGKGNAFIAEYFQSMPDKSMFNSKRWQKEDGTPDMKKLLNSPDGYNQFLQKNLIHRHMNALGFEQYDQMEKYRLELQLRDESLTKKLTQQT